MSHLDSWEIIVNGDPSKTVLVVDFSHGPRWEFNFAELAARIGSGYRYLRAKQPAVSPGEPISSNACISAWSEEIERDGHPVTAVLGSRVGSFYAVGIARHISRWRPQPAVILFDPQSPDLRLLKQEFYREMMSLSSLFSYDEIERARQIGERVAESDTRDIADVAAEMFEDYLGVIVAPFERAGLGAQEGTLIDPFKSHISLISAASQIDQGDSWEGATIIDSSDCPDILGRELPGGGRRLKFDVRRCDLFRSEAITATISDLLQPRQSGSVGVR